ncbi:hypothetical protein LCGC14_1259030 [marine sediment metagenome]|uniref:Uncharacterized protein n=1 Tax=marine sediment metagenome TaxID=412755 RepID=A0A0F9LML1_9ZZZZ
MFNFSLKNYIMKKHRDDDLNLEQLLTRCKELEPTTVIRVYFDPDVYRFDFNHLDELDFFIAPGASFIGQCVAGNVRICIEIFIAQSIRKLSKEAAS